MQYLIRTLANALVIISSAVSANSLQLNQGQSTSSFDNAMPVSFSEVKDGGLFCGESQFYQFIVTGRPQLITIEGTGYEHAFVFKMDRGMSALFGEEIPMEQASTSEGKPIQFVADAGTYYFRVTETSGWCRDFPTPHTFSVKSSYAPIDDYYEYDTDFADILSLTPSTTNNGSLWNHDWRKISIPAGYNGFEIELNQQSSGDLENNQPWVVVWDSSFTKEIAHSQNFNSVAKGGFIEPGDYYVLVTSSTGSFDGDEYELSWQPILAEDDIYEFNNSRYAAAFLPKVQPIDAVHWDDDWYELNVTEGQLNIEILIKYANADSNFRLQLTNVYGNRLFRWSSQLQDDSTLVKNYELPAAGTYYLKVFDESNVIGNNYQLMWQGK